MQKREQMHRRLTKSASDRVVAGVLGGLAQYLHFKPNVVRVVYLIFTALTSFVPGSVIYLILAVLMPDDPHKPNQWRSLMDLFNQGHHAKQPERKELHNVEEKDL